jgi:hypothetical protein
MVGNQLNGLSWTIKSLTTVAVITNIKFKLPIRKALPRDFTTVGVGGFGALNGANEKGCG